MSEIKKTCWGKQAKWLRCNWSMYWCGLKWRRTVLI